MNDGLETILKGVGLKVGRQNYTYRSAGETYAGENVYALLPAPRGDATEAIVLVAPWRVGGGGERLNRGGLALSLALARYFKRWSLWSKDIVLVFPPDTRTGTQAWADAYHDAHDARLVAPLPLKSGALQGAVALDYPQDQGDGGRFESVHIVYDGVNGQLPNLDLINSVVNIANGQGQGSTLQRMWKHRGGSYEDRLRTMLRGMVSQGLGHATGAHSAFIPYHVDAVTIQPVSSGGGSNGGRGWHDEMGLGRLVEGVFRSLNNLLEHLHQSFFFYLLLSKDRFVSIGTYLPSAMLVAANFTIMAISLWVRSGYKEAEDVEGEGEKEAHKNSSSTTGTVNGDSKLSGGGENGKGEITVTTGAATTTTASKTAERHIFLPLGLVVGSHLLGAVPLFIFNHTPSKVSCMIIAKTPPLPFPCIQRYRTPSNLSPPQPQLLTPVFTLFALANAALPHLVSHYILRSSLFATTTNSSSSSSPSSPSSSSPTRQRQFYRLLKSFSLLLLGMFLSALATLNFSLALLVGLLAAPLTFTPVEPSGPSSLSLPAKAAFALLLDVLSPPAVVAVAATAWRFFGGVGLGVGAVLREAAFGWDVWGLYTPLIVWCVWWPAWLVGSVVVLSSGSGESSGARRGKKKVL